MTVDRNTTDSQLQIICPLSPLNINELQIGLSLRIFADCIDENCKTPYLKTRKPSTNGFRAKESAIEKVQIGISGRC